jgi:lysophospholipid acyltransferase (LPLAT)-like uncharacterized protein
MQSSNKKSKRFREFKRRQAYRILPLFSTLGRLMIRGLGSTLRLHYSGENRVLKMVEERRPFVLVFLHGRQFLLVHGIRGWPLVIMTGISYMGEIQSRILDSFGVTTITGSSKGGGARVLATMVKMVRNGMVGAFAVDGPRGPYGVAKPGAVYVAKKLGVPLVPVTTSAASSTLITSAWDHYLLPFPFSSSLIQFGEIITLDDDLSDEAVRRDCRMVEKILEDLTRQADESTGRN